MNAGGFRSGLASLAACALLLTCGCAEMLSAIESSAADARSTPEDGLREALVVGTARAVERLGRADGYLNGGEGVSIPLPGKLERMGNALRTIGAGRYVDQFVTSMNRAAEAAAPLARGVFVDAVREMSFADAMEILHGQRHEATDYLRERAGPRLSELFLPIVRERLDDVGTTRKFDELMNETSKLPLLARPAFDLGDYVTERALDGMFVTLGREEERIREDPLARTTVLLRKWFGSPAVE